MKKYLLLFVLFCGFVTFAPELNNVLPFGVKPAYTETKKEEPAFAVECVCGGKKTVLPLEEYVCTALAEKGYASFPPEALKAMACVIRTRVFAGEIDPLKSRLSELPADITAAAEATRNEYAAYGGAPINAVTHVSSRSRTVSAEEAYGDDVAYLRSVATPEYERGEQAERLTLTPQELCDILRANGFECDVTLRLNAWLTYVSRSESGRIKAVWLCGNCISGEKLAQMLDLGSSDITVDINGGAFEFVCYGKGDGVGLSERGACFMAEEGKTYKEILVHYFSGVELCVNNPAQDG